VDINTLLAYGFALLLIYVLIRLLFVPIRYVALLAYNGVIGGLILWGLNIVGAYLGFYFPINPITALLAGFLGAPGLALLYALRYFVY